jgi:glyoxylase-like metal-dependent hydrolase (beta-lactamase superfamily II)
VSAARLDAVTELVTAPNPSPMTLEGTNTYLLGTSETTDESDEGSEQRRPSRPTGRGEAVVVDPGPAMDEHRGAVESALAGRGVAAVVLTHHHADHSEAAWWAREWGAPVYAASPDLVGSARASALRDGEVLTAGGVSVEAVATPGHASDHLCLRVGQTGTVLAGDHVLGRGTAVVAWPDGDMADYLASLQRLAAVEPTALYPGHGPVVTDPPPMVSWYVEHRRAREGQVLAAVPAAAVTVDQIVASVYPDLDERLRPVAARTVRAHLAKLADEGRVHGPRSRDDGGTGPAPGGVETGPAPSGDAALAGEYWQAVDGGGAADVSAKGGSA